MCPMVFPSCGLTKSKPLLPALISAPMKDVMAGTTCMSHSPPEENRMRITVCLNKYSGEEIRSIGHDANHRYKRGRCRQPFRRSAEQAIKLPSSALVLARQLLKPWCATP